MVFGLHGLKRWKAVGAMALAGMAGGESYWLGNPRTEEIRDNPVYEVSLKPVIEKVPVNYTMTGKDSRYGLSGVARSHGAKLESEVRDFVNAVVRKNGPKYPHLYKDGYWTTREVGITKKKMRFMERDGWWGDRANIGDTYELPVMEYKVVGNVLDRKQVGTQTYRLEKYTVGDLTFYVLGGAAAGAVAGAAAVAAGLICRKKQQPEERKQEQAAAGEPPKPEEKAKPARRSFSEILQYSKSAASDAVASLADVLGDWTKSIFDGYSLSEDWSQTREKWSQKLNKLFPKAKGAEEADPLRKMSKGLYKQATEIRKKIEKYAAAQRRLSGSDLSDSEKKYRRVGPIALNLAPSEKDLVWSEKNPGKNKAAFKGRERLDKWLEEINKAFEKGGWQAARDFYRNNFLYTKGVSTYDGKCKAEFSGIEKWNESDAAYFFTKLSEMSRRGRIPKPTKLAAPEYTAPRQPEYAAPVEITAKSPAEAEDAADNACKPALEIPAQSEIEALAAKRDATVAEIMELIHTMTPEELKAAGYSVTSHERDSTRVALESLLLGCACGEPEPQKHDDLQTLLEWTHSYLKLDTSVRYAMRLHGITYGELQRLNDEDRRKFEVTAMYAYRAIGNSLDLLSRYCGPKLSPENLLELPKERFMKVAEMIDTFCNKLNKGSTDEARVEGEKISKYLSGGKTAAGKPFIVDGAPNEGAHTERNTVAAATRKIAGGGAASLILYAALGRGADTIMPDNYADPSKNTQCYSFIPVLKPSLPDDLAARGVRIASQQENSAIHENSKHAGKPGSATSVATSGNSENVSVPSPPVVNYSQSAMNEWVENEMQKRGSAWDGDYKKLFVEASNALYGSDFTQASLGKMNAAV